jgi:hypothetical protein
MAKLILEKEDIEKLIKEKYNVLEISGINDDIEVILKVEEFNTFSKPTQQKNPIPEPTRKVVVDSSGNIDANASKMVNENRKESVPGGAMGQRRGNLPVF